MNFIKLQCQWRFETIPYHFMSSDKKLWREPHYTDDKKMLGWKEITQKIHQGQLKYRINGKWYSKRKLNQLAYISKEEINTNILKQKPFYDKNTNYNR